MLRRILVQEEGMEKSRNGDQGMMIEERSGREEGEGESKRLGYTRD